MGPVRMISSGHELTTDYDEKTLHELGFKDMQVTSVPAFTCHPKIVVNTGMKMHNLRISSK